jgi:hypothetical protein
LHGKPEEKSGCDECIAEGFGNGLAAYCHYKAVAISLSRTAFLRSGMTCWPLDSFDIGALFF